MNLLNETRIVITGSRFWEDDVIIPYAIEQIVAGCSGKPVIIQGECPYGGADLIAKNYAERRGYKIESFEPEWKDGKVLGPQRNKRMLEAGADIVLAFPFPNSRGTVDCVKKAMEMGIPVKVYEQNFKVGHDEDVKPNHCSQSSRIHFSPHKGCILR
ncbi:hypothetical protein GMA3_55 [Gordonia phage GMA3]|uniref:YspA cpYpsA-related SLOG domain-containing protein n=1 Tax=Gordonia phage GMA3 TaxID=1647284 RepID=A0A0K0NL06_9CAUD|nr:hypothetical protein AU105_gp055 [Gordonia phage GMA3]AKL88232.1 hypothetical protein GMA3_55 [Gordonia phage GMA3]